MIHQKIPGIIYLNFKWPITNAKDINHIFLYLKIYIEI